VSYDFDSGLYTVENEPKFGRPNSASCTENVLETRKCFTKDSCYTIGSNVRMVHYHNGASFVDHN